MIGKRRGPGGNFLQGLLMKRTVKMAITPNKRLAVKVLVSQNFFTVDTRRNRENTNSGVTACIADGSPSVRTENSFAEASRDS
jgi:hypothetical protein